VANTNTEKVISALAVMTFVYKKETAVDTCTNCGVFI